MGCFTMLSEMINAVNAKFEPFVRYSSMGWLTMLSDKFEFSLCLKAGVGGVLSVDQIIREIRISERRDIGCVGFPPALLLAPARAGQLPVPRRLLWSRGRRPAPLPHARRIQRPDPSGYMYMYMYVYIYIYTLYITLYTVLYIILRRPAYSVYAEFVVCDPSAAVPKKQPPLYPPLRDPSAAVLKKKTSPLSATPPAAEIALQPPIWCFSKLIFQLVFSSGGVFFHRHRYGGFLGQ